MQRKFILLIIFCTWLFGVLIYGCIDIYNTLEELRVNPSPDLYANSIGFQIIVFALSKGMASLLLLGVGLVVGFSCRVSTKQSN